MFNNRSIFTVCIHGYGGQGVKTIANVLAKASIEEGLYAQAFPEFGPERRGAPVKAYGRFSSNPIMTRSSIEKPDFVIILDKNILNLETVREGIGKETYFLIQTDSSSKEIKKQFSFLPDYHRIHCIDGTSQILEYNNKVHPSIPVIGKFIRITEMVPLETIKDLLNKEFMEKIGEEKMRLTEKALEEAYYKI